MQTKIVSRLEETVSNFDEISLKQLKQTRRLFSRIDTKYVTDISTLFHLLSQIQDSYDILGIDGKHIFLYDTIYLDTPDYYFYKQHIDGTSMRTKVRTRHYVDTDLAYFEVKLKSRNNKKTHKYRIKVPTRTHGEIQQEGWKLYNKIYQKTYEAKPDHELIPQTKTIYRRMTLAHKTLPEKVTIDIGLTFEHPGHTSFSFDELVVIEVKHESADNYLGALIRDYGYGFRDHCSKYCLSLCYLDVAAQKEYFMETMKAINEIEALQEDVLDSLYISAITKQMS